jgi:hypothetical protein
MKAESGGPLKSTPIASVRYAAPSLFGVDLFWVTKNRVRGISPS